MGTDVSRRAVEGPPGHRVHSALDLKAGRPMMAVQLVAGAVVALAVGVAVAVDLPTGDGWTTVVTVVVTLGACGAYLMLHELTHGVSMRLLAGSRPTFAVRFPYLTTGSDAWLSRGRFVVVALAPAVLWGAVIAALLVVAPPDWLLTLYVLTVLNLAGSAGDVVQVWVAARLPAGALLRDDGRVTTAVVPGRHRSACHPTA